MFLIQAYSHPGGVYSSTDKIKATWNVLLLLFNNIVIKQFLISSKPNFLYIHCFCCLVIKKNVRLKILKYLEIEESK